MNLIIHIIFIMILVSILLSLNNVLTNIKNTNTEEKISSYECGFTTITSQNRKPIQLQYYLVCILYLIFDIEIIFLVPSILSFELIGLTGFTIIFIFIVILTIGFLYEIKSGVLNWSQES